MIEFRSGFLQWFKALNFDGTSDRRVKDKKNSVHFNMHKNNYPSIYPNLP